MSLLYTKCAIFIVLLDVVKFVISYNVFMKPNKFLF